MAKSTDDKLRPDIAGTNPDVQSQNGQINPSAPSVGTEGWGNTADERRVLSSEKPSATRAGQMKGNPGDNKTEGAQKMEAERRGGPGRNQADLTPRTSASAHSVNTSHGGTDHIFRCADAGNRDCRWETSGSSAEDVMQRVEEHGRRDHGFTDWTEAMRNKVRDAIHCREAA